MEHAGRRLERRARYMKDYIDSAARWSRAMADFDVVVIGAGCGGLTAGAAKLVQRHES